MYMYTHARVRAVCTVYVLYIHADGHKAAKLIPRRTLRRITKTKSDLSISHDPPPCMNHGPRPCLRVGGGVARGATPSRLSVNDNDKMAGNPSKNKVVGAITSTVRARTFYFLFFRVLRVFFS